MYLAVRLLFDELYRQRKANEKCTLHGRRKVQERVEVFGNTVKAMQHSHANFLEIYFQKVEWNQANLINNNQTCLRYLSKGILRHFGGLGIHRVYPK